MSRDGWHETAGLHKHVQYMCISTLQSDICYSIPTTTSWKGPVILQEEAKIVWKRGEQHLSTG